MCLFARGTSTCAGAVAIARFLQPHAAALIYQSGYTMLHVPKPIFPIFSYLFPAYRNRSKVIVLNWLSSLLSDTVSRQHGDSPFFQPKKVYPFVLPCLLRRRNGAEVCVFYLVSEIVSAQYFFESLSEPKAQWLPACPAGSRVWMTTVQSGRLVMGNQTKPCKELVENGGNNNRVLLAIDCFYCNCFLPAFMALFIRYQQITRVLSARLEDRSSGPTAVHFLGVADARLVVLATWPSDSHWLNATNSSDWNTLKPLFLQHTHVYLYITYIYDHLCGYIYR